MAVSYTHLAEHKTINCIEHGEELTPENAAKYSRFHKRCGTSFLFIVMFVSILFFLLFFQIFPIESMALKVVCRISVSYTHLTFGEIHTNGCIFCVRGGNCL